MLRVTMRDIQSLEADMRTFASEAMPYATRSTVNTTAFRGRKIAARVIDQRMITRNRFTMRSVQVEPTKTLNVDKQASKLGSTQEYMAVQETGGARVAEGRFGVPIPTSYAANQGMSQRPRTRLPTRRRRTANIKLMPGGDERFVSKRQEITVKTLMARRAGYKFVFIDARPYGARGIYELVGRERNMKMRMVYNLDRKTVQIPPNPWLSDTVERVERLVPEIYFSALRFQLDRRGLFDKRLGGG